MKKKFKLIKKYPGSPVLNTEINEDGFYGSMTTWCNPKDYPEFWEEVIEKDYEILEYRTEDGISCKAPFLQDSHQFYMNERCKINSIKRKSDGEIFTVGDKCSPIGKYRDNIHSITKIWFCNPGYLRLSSNNYTLGIKDIQKVKKPLFTTEDGVDIFENDKIYWINAYTLDDVYCDTYYQDCGEFDLKDGLISVKEFNKLNKDDNELALLGFSTKEKAEEYIIMNKPCLSLNDIFKNVEELRKGLKTFENSELGKRFKKLVQQKLNK